MFKSRTLQFLLIALSVNVWVRVRAREARREHICILRGRAYWGETSARLRLNVRQNNLQTQRSVILRNERMSGERRQLGEGRR